MIIVVCIAALVVVVVLGIYHIHVTHQQEVRLEDTTKEEDESWDDSALTITVNPMEVGESFGGGVHAKVVIRGLQPFLGYGPV